MPRLHVATLVCLALIAGLAGCHALVPYTGRDGGQTAPERDGGPPPDVGLGEAAPAEGGPDVGPEGGPAGMVVDDSVADTLAVEIPHRLRVVFERDKLWQAGQVYDLAADPAVNLVHPRGRSQLKFHVLVAPIGVHWEQDWYTLGEGGEEALSWRRPDERSVEVTTSWSWESLLDPSRRLVVTAVHTISDDGRWRGDVRVTGTQPMTIRQREYAYVSVDPTLAWTEQKNVDGRSFALSRQGGGGRTEIAVESLEAVAPEIHSDAERNLYFADGSDLQVSPGSPVTASWRISFAPPGSATTHAACPLWPSCELLLADDFAGATLSSSRWENPDQTPAACRFDVAGGGLAITAPANRDQSYCFLRSTQGYDLRGGAAMVKVAQASTGKGMQTIFALFKPKSIADHHYVALSEGRFIFWHNESVYGDVTYQPSRDVWWRLRDDSSQGVVFETAPTASGPWGVRLISPSSTSLDDVEIRVATGTHDSVPQPIAARFDCISVVRGCAP